LPCTRCTKATSRREKNQLDQAGDQAAEGRHRLVRAQAALGDLLAPGGQGIQIAHHPGHERQGSGCGALAWRQLRGKGGAQAGLNGHGLGHRGLPLGRKALPT
jgi:hypothetical protein